MERMDRYLEEILGQPDAFRRAADAVAARPEVLAAVGAVRDGTGVVLLAGMGSSYDACLAAAAALGAGGVPVLPVEASELLHVRRPLLAAARLVVLVSQSGESPEVVQLADVARALPAPRPVLLAITNGLATPLAGLADLVLDTAAGAETCPSSMTFAGALVALSAVAGVLGGTTVAAAVAATRSEAAGAATAVRALLADADRLSERVGQWSAGRDTFVLLGRGVGLAAAEMGALTLQEAAGIPALALPTAEFRHGPLEIVGPDVAVVLFALVDAAADLDRAFAVELGAAGAAVLLIGAPTGSAPPEAVPDGVELIEMPADPSGITAAGIALVPVQLLARRLAAAKGRVPGAFMLASKVTLRE